MPQVGATSKQGIGRVGQASRVTIVAGPQLRGARRALAMGRLGTGLRITTMQCRQPAARLLAGPCLKPKLMLASMPAFSPTPCWL